MTFVSWFLTIGVVCYLGSMIYTLVIANIIDKDISE